MARKKKKADQDLEMDMTPMIDIVFNLLIFFMLISDLTNKDIAKLILPIASTAVEDKGRDPNKRYILNITNNGQLRYKGQPISLEVLGTRLRQLARLYDQWEDFGKFKASKLFILVRADKDTPWQHVQWVMTVMSEQKLYKLQFGVKQYADGEYSDKKDEAAALDAQWKE